MNAINNQKYNLQKSPVWKLILNDLLLICAILGTFVYFHLFRQEVSDIVPDAGTAISGTATSESGTASGTDAGITDEYENSVFTRDVIITDSSYTSPNVSVEIIDGTCTTEKGEDAVYHLADIYVKDITLLRTVFADDKYGKYVNEETPHMAERTGAICAINGDYYGMTWGTMIIRNGVLYGSELKSKDVCVLYLDGTMTTYKADEFNGSAEIEKGAWQAWSFGPGLLDANGNPIENFSSHVKKSNPRTVIGYFEPGHYGFITVDGRQSTSAGLTLRELSALCAELGMKCAYNLDGGQTSVMTFMDRIANSPYNGGRVCSDFVCVFDSTSAATEAGEE